MKTTKQWLLLALLGLGMAASANAQVYWQDQVINGGYPTLMDNTNYGVDQYNRIFFIGSNGRIYWSEETTGWNANVLNPAGYLARAGSDLLCTPGYHYYTGANDEVCCYWWTGSGWQSRILDVNFEDVKDGTSFTIDDNGRIYYVGMDGYVYFIDRVGNTFTSARLNLGTGPKARENSNIVYDNNHIYYVSESDQLCNYWWGSTSGFAVINSSWTTVKEKTPINVGNGGRVFFVNPLDVIFAADPNGGWTYYWWMPSTKVDGDNVRAFSYDDSKHYYTDVNGKIGCVTWNGSALVQQFLHGSITARTNTYFNTTNNGDLIYCSSADNKLHLLTPVVHWSKTNVLTSNWSQNGTQMTNTVERWHHPQDKQLYPRDNQDNGQVHLEGDLFGFNSVTVDVIKTDFNGVQSTTSYSVPVSNNHFNTTINIHAELSEYQFDYRLSNQTTNNTIAEKVVCGDIYLFSGQSNAEARAIPLSDYPIANAAYGENSPDGYGKYSRTFHRDYHHGHKTWDNSQLVHGDYTYTVGSIGLYLQYLIQKDHGIPTCLINNGVAGMPLVNHQIAYPEGPYYFNGTGSYVLQDRYLGHLNTWIYEIGAENNVKGMLWWQGESDVDEPVGYYGLNWPLYHYYLDGTINNPFTTYMVQIHAWPNWTSHPFDRVGSCIEDQRNMNTHVTTGTVKLVASNGLETDGIHYTLNGYKDAAKAILHQLAEDHYGAPVSVANKPLDIRYIYWHNGRLYLEFNQNIHSGNSDALANVMNAVRLSNGATKSNPSISGKEFSFDVSTQAGLTQVSYLDLIPSNWDYACHLRNSNNLGCLGFHEFPVDYPIIHDPGEEHKPGFRENVAGLATDTPMVAEVTVYPNPTAGAITLSATGSGMTSVKVMNTTGQVVLEQSVNGQNQVDLDLSDLSAGWYQVAIETANGAISHQKIIKE